MSPALSNDWLEFDLSPSDGVWSVRPRGREGPHLAGIRMSALWRASGGKRRWEGPLVSPEGPQEVALSTALGEAQSLRLRGHAGGGVELELQRGVLSRSPLSIWRATLRNRSKGAIEAEANFVVL